MKANAEATSGQKASSRHFFISIAILGALGAALFWYKLHEPTTPPSPESLRRSMQIQNALDGADFLKKKAKDPSNFKLESLQIINESGDICYEYRGKNSFGATVPGRAVAAPNGMFKTDVSDEFSSEWDSRCTRKPSHDVMTYYHWFR